MAQKIVELPPSRSNIARSVRRWLPILLFCKMNVLTAEDVKWPQKVFACTQKDSVDIMFTPTQYHGY